jgi:uncharacterized membrane protein YjfL (UPF0719 family)
VISEGKLVDLVYTQAIQSKANTMDISIILVGFTKLVFGVLVGVIGLSTAARLTKRVAGLPDIDTALEQRNIAVGISLAGAILAMGLLVQHAVENTFSAFDLLQYSADGWLSIMWIFAYAVGLVVVALLSGAVVILVSVRASVRLTPGIDEIAQIRDGNIATAIVMATVLVVIALLARQGLDTMLNGLLPLPALGRGIN